MREPMDNNPEFKEIVRALLKKMGKDFSKCEQCKADLKGKRYEITDKLS